MGRPVCLSLAVKYPTTDFSVKMKKKYEELFQWGKVELYEYGKLMLKIGIFSLFFFLSAIYNGVGIIVVSIYMGTHGGL